MVYKWHVANIHTVSDVLRAAHDLWALCLYCGHTKRIDTLSLSEKYGEQALDDLRRNLKCERCKQFHGQLVPYDGRRLRR